MAILIDQFLGALLCRLTCVSHLSHTMQDESDELAMSNPVSLLKTISVGKVRCPPRFPQLTNASFLATLNISVK